MATRKKEILSVVFPESESYNLIEFVVNNHVSSEPGYEEAL